MSNNELEEPATANVWNRRIAFACVILAILFLARGYFWSPAELRHDFASDVEECRDNLRRVYDGLIEYDSQHGGLPQGSGAVFLGQLIEAGVWENDEGHARLLQCPAASPESRGLLTAPKTWFQPLSEVDGSRTSYAARNFKQYPLLEFPTPGNAPLVACDNEIGHNHASGVTNVLMADGSVVSFELEVEQAEGRVPREAQVLVVGPLAELEELRRMSLD